jgi:citrate lyase beta subunit
VDVWWVDVLLTQLEAKLGLRTRIRLEVLIEDVAGLTNAEQIAVAGPRLDALISGAGTSLIPVSGTGRVTRAGCPSHDHGRILI